MDTVLDFAKDYNLVVIEDAAQAMESEYGKKRAGSMGDFGCFSFFPSQNLGAFGDGGMVTTDSDEFNHNLQILRNHGAEPKYYHKIVGGNFRLDALQAAFHHYETLSTGAKMDFFQKNSSSHPRGPAPGMLFRSRDKHGDL